MNSPKFLLYPHIFGGWPSLFLQQEFLPDDLMEGYTSNCLSRCTRWAMIANQMPKINENEAICFQAGSVFVYDLGKKVWESLFNWHIWAVNTQTGEIYDCSDELKRACTVLEIEHCVDSHTAIGFGPDRRLHLEALRKNEESLFFKESSLVYAPAAAGVTSVPIPSSVYPLIITTSIKGFLSLKDLLLFIDQEVGL